MKESSLIVLLLALVLAVLLSLAGCTLAMLHAIDKGQTLDPEQIKAYKEMSLEVYGCFQIGGPPPAGNTVWIIVPKGSPVNFTFADNCHLLNR